MNVSIRWNCNAMEPMQLFKEGEKVGDFSLQNCKKLYGAHKIEMKAVHVRRCAMYEYAVKGFKTNKNFMCKFLVT